MNCAKCPGTRRATKKTNATRKRTNAPRLRLPDHRVVLFLLLSAVVSLMGKGRPVQAALLAYEPFDYPSATAGDPLTGLNGGSGWASPWQESSGWQPLQVTPSPGLETLSNSFPFPPGSQATVTAISPQGGYAYNPEEVLSGNLPYGRVSSRMLTQPIDLSVDQEVYLSFLFRRQTDNEGVFNTLRAVLSLNSGPHPVNDAEIQIGAPSTGGTNSMEALLSGTVVDATMQDDGVFNDTTYLVVARIEAHSGNTPDRVYFERFSPGSTLELPNPWDKFSTASINNETIDRLLLWGESAWAVDEIRIGTSFDSVTTSMLPVPEPSSSVLCICGIVGLIVTRRRAKSALRVGMSKRA